MMWERCKFAVKMKGVDELWTVGRLSLNVEEGEEQDDGGMRWQEADIGMGDKWTGGVLREQHGGWCIVVTEWG